jgi:hypothetical protein
MKEYIICAAIHVNNGKVYVHQPKNITTGFVICGRRHHNCFATLSLINDEPKDKLVMIQGFLTNEDKFYNRSDSYKIAVESGQTIDDSAAKTLISEDLY